MFNTLRVVLAPRSAGWHPHEVEGSGMRRFSAALGVCAFAALNSVAFAAPKTDIYVTILSGEAAWLPISAAIAEKLDHENGLRILPVLGAGGVQALVDLSQIPSIDAAVVASDSLAYAKSQNLVSNDNNSLSYVAKLSPLDLVLITRSTIKNVTGLAGKRIATGPAQSAGFASGELLFNALEIPFKRIPKQGDAAIQALVDGQADAALILGTSFNKTMLANGKFQVLSLTMPPNLESVYQPALLNAQQLPGLIAKAGSVETISASLTLAVKDWPKGSPHAVNLAAFIAELYKAQGDGLAVNLAASVPGWTRQKSTKELLGQIRTGADTPHLITPTGGEP